MCDKREIYTKVHELKLLLLEKILSFDKDKPISLQTDIGVAINKAMDKLESAYEELHSSDSKTQLEQRTRELMSEWIIHMEQEQDNRSIWCENYINGCELYAIETLQYQLLRNENNN